MKEVKIGKFIVPLWLIVALLVAGVGASVYYVWKTLTIPLEVKEPLEVISYPNKLSLYPGETIEFNVTIRNYAPVNYTVILDFHLDNETYQANYVTFGQETYVVVPGENILKAWLRVEKYAPPTSASLTIHFRRCEYGGTIFYDGFEGKTSELWRCIQGNWYVTDEEYVCYVPGIIETGISIIPLYNISNCVIETKLKFIDDVGYMAGIIFRYSDLQHFYIFEITNEYDNVGVNIHTPDNPEYGRVLKNVEYSVSKNIDYVLKIEVNGTTFRTYVNGVELFIVNDSSYSIGAVGLYARRAVVKFDYFKLIMLP